MTIIKGWDDNDMSTWLRDRTLGTLAGIARLADLANHPETNAWYRKELRKHAQALLAYHLPCVALIHDAERESAVPDEFEAIAEGGTKALETWCTEWSIENPYSYLSDLGPEDPDLDRAEVVEPPARSPELRQAIRSGLCRQGFFILAHENFSIFEHRIYALLLNSSCPAEEPDVVAVSRQHLPGDIDCEAEAVAGAWKALHDRGLLETIPGQDPAEDRLLVKLVCQGVNESRSPASFQEVEFGMHVDIPKTPRLVPVGIIPKLDEEEMLALRSWFGRSEENQIDLLKCLEISLDPTGGHIVRVEVIASTVIVYSVLPKDADKKAVMERMTDAIRHLLAEHGGTNVKA